MSEKKSGSAPISAEKLFGNHMASYQQDVGIYTNKSFSIINRGKDIDSTNYFDTELGKSGGILLSWNAGAARLLMPPQHAHIFDELCTAKELMIHPFRHINQHFLFLVFEDYSAHPYCIYISAGQMDRNIPIKRDFLFPFTLYSTTFKLSEIPGHFIVDIPKRFDHDIISAKNQITNVLRKQNS